MSARSYQAHGSVVIDVIDEFCPGTAGCWRIGSAGVERTDESPGLPRDISVLGSVYLGGFTRTQLARGLRVQELHSGAVAHADTVLKKEVRPGVLSFSKKWPGLDPAPTKVFRETNTDLGRILLKRGNRRDGGWCVQWTVLML